MTEREVRMKAIIVAAALAILTGCAQLEQKAAYGGTSVGYERQFNNGFPYNAPGW
jgi:hypothetical protein